MLDRVGRSNGDDVSLVDVDLEGCDVGAFEGLNCGVWGSYTNNQSGHEQ